MYNFDIYSTGTSVAARVYNCGNPRETHVESGFRSPEEAERWAEHKAERLEEKARQFAADPITQYYGL